VQFKRYNYCLAPPTVDPSIISALSKESSECDPSGSSNLTFGYIIWGRGSVLTFEQSIDWHMATYIIHLHQVEKITRLCWASIGSLGILHVPSGTVKCHLWGFIPVPVHITVLSFGIMHFLKVYTYYIYPYRSKRKRYVLHCKLRKIHGQKWRKSNVPWKAEDPASLKTRKKSHLGPKSLISRFIMKSGLHCLFKNSTKL